MDTVHPCEICIGDNDVGIDSFFESTSDAVVGMVVSAAAIAMETALADARGLVRLLTTMRRGGGIIFFDVLL